MNIKLSNLLMIALVLLVGIYLKLDSVEVNISEELRQETNWGNFPGFEFDSLNLNKSTLYKYSSLAEEVVIPYEMDSGRVIRIIGAYAFHNIKMPLSDYPREILGSVKHDENYIYSKVSEVTFTEGLKEIEEGAFKENNLTEVMLPEGVKVGPDAFKDNIIESVGIRGASIISEGAFAGNKVAEIMLEGEEPIIDDNAFGFHAPLIYSGSGTYHFNGQNWIKD